MTYGVIGAAIVVVLLIWLIPVRRHGIPGLGGRGKLLFGPRLTHLIHLGRMDSPDEVAGKPDMTGKPDGDRRNGRDERLLAELDAAWDPRYADRVTAEHQARKKSA